MTDILLSVLYPPRCPACRRLMENDGSLIHSECRGLFRLIREPRCLKCGRNVEAEDIAVCPECAKKKHRYDYGLAVMEYNSTARQAMTDYKFSGWRANADFFAEEAVNKFEEILKLYGPEALIPVPVTRRRLHERGFNQAELLAVKISERTGIPVDTELLFKRSGLNVQQKKLSARERKENARLAFTAAKSEYKKVCIVDDIYTTGSTLDACAGVLKQAGAEEVGFLVICAGSSY